MRHLRWRRCIPCDPALPWPTTVRKYPLRWLVRRISAVGSVSHEVSHSCTASEQAEHGSIHYLTKRISIRATMLPEYLHAGCLSLPSQANSPRDRWCTLHRSTSALGALDISVSVFHTLSLNQLTRNRLSQGRRRCRECGCCRQVIALPGSARVSRKERKRPGLTRTRRRFDVLGPV